MALKDKVVSLEGLDVVKSNIQTQLDGAISNVQTQLDGKANSSHNHSASNITSGTLPIDRGGTGATTVAAVRNNLGLGNTSEALPVPNGGTGATTASEALTNFGIPNARNITISTADPTSSDGSNNDVWIVYGDAQSDLRVKKTLLWTNASPTSSFTSQTIALDLSSFDEVEIIFNFSNTAEKVTNILRSGLRRSMLATGIYEAKIAKRETTVNIGSIVFGDCVAYTSYGSTSNTTTYNNGLIPYKIYGVKGV